MLVFNTIALILVLVLIRRERKVSEQLKQRHINMQSENSMLYQDSLIRHKNLTYKYLQVTRKAIDRSTAKQDFGICWKLTAVFGLTWMLGIGVQYHIALRIAFILCNSLQGINLWENENRKLKA